MAYVDDNKNKECKRRCYVNNRELFAERQRAARNKTRDHIAKLKEHLKCLRCGNDNQIVLEFHHRDPNEKEITISSMIRNKWACTRIDREIEKCDILCANCHRIVHHEWRTLKNDVVDGS